MEAHFRLLLTLCQLRSLVKASHMFKSTIRLCQGYGCIYTSTVGQWKIDTNNLIYYNDEINYSQNWNFSVAEIRNSISWSEKHLFRRYSRVAFKACSSARWFIAHLFHVVCSGFHLDSHAYALSYHHSQNVHNVFILPFPYVIVINVF